MQVVATAKIKIPVTTEIVQTIKVFGVGLQYCIDTAWKHGIKNNFKLHHITYAHLRGLGLPSQLAISCIKQACRMVKKAKSKPTITRASVGYNFPRSASFRTGLLKLATVASSKNKRIKIPFTVPACYQQYFSPEWTISESLLRMDTKGRVYFLFTFSKEANVDATNLQSRVLGIDLGVNKLASTSACSFYGKKVKQLRIKRDLLVGNLQAKGTRAAKRKLKKLSGSWTRFMAWTNHNISKRIVQGMRCGDVVVLEDLTNIRNRTKYNAWTSKWAFRQLQNFIDYKAGRRGVRVAYCNPAYTSKECSVCHERNTVRHGGFLHCNVCGHSVDADLNASRNIAERYTRNFGGAIVNRPILTCNETFPVKNDGFLVEHSQKLRNLVAV